MVAKLLLGKGDDPFFSWTERSIKDYVIQRPLAAGDRMLIINCQAGFEWYTLTTVVNADIGRQHRIELVHAADFGGSTFFRTGKNCLAPTGQSRMIPPVPEIVKIIESTENCHTIRSNRHYGIPS